MSCSLLPWCQCDGRIRTGVATTFLAKEPGVLYTTVMDMFLSNPVLRDTLDTVEEMTKLIQKKSPKCEVLFQKVKGGIACDSPGICLLCPTRWTVCAAVLTSISENYCGIVGYMGTC